jgi:hypothetical protein
VAGRLLVRAASGPPWHGCWKGRTVAGNHVDVLCLQGKERECRRRKALSAPGNRPRCSLQSSALLRGLKHATCSGRGRRASPRRAHRARAQVGGRLAGVFDEDPKRWRLTAEVFKTAGLAAEVATQFFPGSFVVLAGGGNFARAVGKGLGNPCFRIIQTHQAAAGNVGDIAAKEEARLLAPARAARRLLPPRARVLEARARPPPCGAASAPGSPGRLQDQALRSRPRMCPAERARMAVRARTGRSRPRRHHKDGRATTGFVASRPATKVKPSTLPCTSAQPPRRVQVWEVAAQLAGLGASVLLLRGIEATGRPENVVAVWAGLQAAHVALRYQSLAVLRFGSLNQKRACACAAAHAAGRPVPGAALCCCPSWV